jgi:hypothetical protein
VSRLFVVHARLEMQTACQPRPLGLFGLLACVRHCIWLPAVAIAEIDMSGFAAAFHMRRDRRLDVLFLTSAAARAVPFGHTWLLHRIAGRWQCF